MLMPSKITKTEDSIMYISSLIIKALIERELSFEDIHLRINNESPKKISIQKAMLGLNFLYTIGKVELTNETIKIKL